MIARQLGMEREPDDRALTNTDNPRILQSGEHLDSVADGLDQRCSNEHAVDRVTSQRWDRQVLLEAVHLAPKRIAPHVDVQRVESVDGGSVNTICQHDQARARPQDGQARGDAIAQQLYRDQARASACGLSCSHRPG